MDVGILPVVTQASSSWRRRVPVGFSATFTSSPVDRMVMVRKTAC